MCCAAGVPLQAPTAITWRPLDNKLTLEPVVPLADPMRSRAGKDYSRRTSSGNWIEDRVTAKEQIMYKKAMGYL